jgi:hypothetical protein
MVPRNIISFGLESLTIGFSDIAESSRELSKSSSSSYIPPGILLIISSSRSMLDDICC